ncbi:MAG: pyruvate formate-lyase-activating protein [Oscillospiraceae bacterium]
MNEIKGMIHSIESFGSADGPGVRYIFFLKGCPMRCKYCHNPDTWGSSALLEELTPQQAYEKAARYKPYWKNGGGITVSGGEALLQIDFVTELFKIAKEHGVNTCLDTSGQPFTRSEPKFSKFKELIKYTDLFLLDIKEIDNEKHKELTGCSNESILDFARFLSDEGKNMWIRYVLVPTVTNDKEDLEKTRAFIDTLKTVERVEVLPYHTLGVFKWENLGIKYGLEGVPTPTSEEVKEAKEILGAL